MAGRRVMCGLEVAISLQPKLGCQNSPENSQDLQFGGVCEFLQTGDVEELID
ncbi:hypothetical protein BWQ96_05195 [Gracilariopsis chorda]|uniref:Uncharacterized protein n=1 Tax=Gracilariopsis chorda TaxID=448386 RepID=A0A2V3ISH3_9FLOR|nr:hypothetical protein BWQ96_05195 [Gracilariopsis chorda]|eukprot:PXF45054.1 hypothetical protein BWQ96_05195 [Gracilariopsis chorda]